MHYTGCARCVLYVHYTGCAHCVLYVHYTLCTTLGVHNCTCVCTEHATNAEHFPQGLLTTGSRLLTTPARHSRLTTWPNWFHPIWRSAPSIFYGLLLIAFYCWSGCSSKKHPQGLAEVNLGLQVAISCPPIQLVPGSSSDHWLLNIVSKGLDSRQALKKRLSWIAATFKKPLMQSIGYVFSVFYT